MASPETWTPPVVRPGDTVYHSPDGTRNSKYPALVTKVGARTVHLWLIGGHVVEGARHIDDPMLNDVQIQEFGCWRLTESAEAILELARSVKDLVERVGILEAAAAGRGSPRGATSGVQTGKT